MALQKNPSHGPEDILDAIKVGDEDNAIKWINEATVDERNRHALVTWAMHDGDWDTGEHTLLHWACDGPKLDELNPGVKASPRIVRALISSGISPNTPGEAGTTPLVLIAKCSDPNALEIVKYLLEECGADPNLSTQYGYAPLHEAATWGSPDAIKLLLDNHARSDLLTGGRETALELAVKRLTELRDGDEEEIARFDKAVKLLEQADSVDDINFEFEGFFYSGNWKSNPSKLKRMKVAAMLDPKELIKDESMSHNTRWFHLPANNRRWVEDLVCAILDADKTVNPSDNHNETYRETIESEVKSLMKKCGPFKRSRYPARSFRVIPIGTENDESRRYCDKYHHDDSANLGVNSEELCFVSMPFIENDIDVSDDKTNQNYQQKHIQLSETQKKKRKNLIRLQEDHPDDVFPRLTLDRFYYDALEDKAIRDRDSSQVFSKYCHRKRMLYVGQLWALRIGERTLITASQSSFDEVNIQSPADRFLRSCTKVASRKTLRPADIYYELQERCVDLVAFHSAGNERILSVHEAFSREIAQVSHYMKEKYECYMLGARMIQKAKIINLKAGDKKTEIDDIIMHCPEIETNEIAFQGLLHAAKEDDVDVLVKVRELAGEESKDPGREALEVRDDISKECEKLAEIMDVIDELNIINTVLEEQYEVAKWSFRGKDPLNYIRDVRPTFRGLLRESEEVRKSIIELLKLREQEIAIKNAVETANSADEQASTKIAATVFTVVTFIYTPFSFGFSILGSPIAGFSSGYSAGTAICAMVLTLLATVALLVFLLPILTVVKKPWTHWVVFVTNGTRKVFGLDSKKKVASGTTAMGSMTSSEDVYDETKAVRPFAKRRRVFSQSNIA